VKIKIKYAIPIAYFIYGEKEIETDVQYFDDISHEERVRIMTQIAEDQNCIPVGISQALEVGYAKFEEANQ